MRAAIALDGIIVIDKPSGWTSHDVVAKARGITGQRRIGHTGTLDPAATGVLVLCLGQATRLVEYMSTHEKRYEGEIVLGVSTATDDAEGEVLEERPIPALDDEVLRQLERAFTGPLQQRPPAFSAIKVDGMRAYKRARAGDDAPLPSRPVVVHSLALERNGEGRLGIRVHCGPGTYIRSIARDIGEALGCGAHLANLRRTSAGNFSLSDALTLEQLGGLVAGGDLVEILLQPDEGVATLDAVLIATECAARLRLGLALDGQEPPVRAAAVARIYDASGSFVGIGSVAGNGEIHAIKVLNLAKPASSA